MTLAQPVIGIDISKRHLDLCNSATGQTWRIGNHAQAMAALVAGLSPDCLVVFEATGAYDRLLRLALSAAGIAHARVPPSRARAFAKAIGRIAKSDPIDARLLAQMGACLPLRREQAPDEARERLTRLQRRRDALVAMRAAEEARQHDAIDPEVAQSLAEHIKALNRAVATVEAAVREHLAAHPELARAARLLSTAPGVGPVTAAILVALLPELGRRSPKSVAALVGLAPFNHDSGQSSGERRIQEGRRRVRRALYMAAVTAARCSAGLQGFYQRLLAAGKPPKLALIALARKLLTILNAMMRTQTPFHA